jgi:thiosulfate/3-mercaptopyruvate sulfurtransferase
MTHFIIKNLADLKLLNKYQFIDCTYYLPNEEKHLFHDAPKMRHDDIFFCVDSIADVQSPFGHTFPPLEIFRDYSIKNRLNYGTHYIFYDHKGIFSSPRVYFTFLAYGFDKISVLDGGYPAFKNLELPENPIIHTENHAIDLKNPLHIFVNHDAVTHAIDNKNYKIIDARPKGRFDGIVAEPRAGLESGHIPTSLNLPFTDLLTPQKTFKSVADITDIFTKLGIAPTDNLIISCGSGITACIVAFAALMCGFSLKKIQIYDASWCEWGNGNFKVVR